MGCRRPRKDSTFMETLLSEYGLIFVVDSNDRDRIGDSAEELKNVLSDDELQNVTILIFANKQDLPHAMSTEDIAKELRLREIRNNYHIQGTCATQGVGLFEGLDWLSDQLSKLS
ncbi:ADP-ribosylation factor 4 [Schistosoma japonicum]|nr:ADP-ribosylation factor 4 [Schistosoma japonicum]